MEGTALPRIDDELTLLASLVPLDGARIVEAGCGAAALARALVERHRGAQVTALEVDDRQHEKNLQAPAPGLTFVRAGAQAIPAGDASFDGALMLKSLHHVPVGEMADALAEIARVLAPGGWLYVAEPVADGPLNEITRLFNDEQAVRAAAQRALDDAVAGGRWTQAAERRYLMPVHFSDFADFERKLMRPTFADHRIDDAMLARVAARYAPHQRADGARFVRPMHVRLLRRR